MVAFDSDTEGGLYSRISGRIKKFQLEPEE